MIGDEVTYWKVIRVAEQSFAAACLAVSQCDEIIDDYDANHESYPVTLVMDIINHRNANVKTKDRLEAHLSKLYQQRNEVFKHHPKSFETEKFMNSPEKWDEVIILPDLSVDKMKMRIVNKDKKSG